MLHARLFKENPKYRDEHFQPNRKSLISKKLSDEPAWLDGNPATDRPLFVQFCANKPDELLEAAEYVAPYCDAVDLNLGCPQGIAKSGHYGAFLQEDWNTIRTLITRLYNDLSIPITAKFRILETREETLEYAKMIQSAGASILTVHGRRREQKGHNMGVADWSMIRYLRDNLHPETVIFANGNIMNSTDLEACLEATGADAVMSAEGNLSDPTVFALPPSDPESREYWWGPNGAGGYRIDSVLRRYLDIIHRDVLEQDPPQRQPLYVPGDSNRTSSPTSPSASITPSPHIIQKRGRKRKRDNTSASSPNLRVMQGHLFQILRPLVSTHTDIRDALAQCRTGDIAAFENVLNMVEAATRKALDEEAASSPSSEQPQKSESGMTASERTIAKYKRPWWVCQPHIRPSPDEALKKGALQLTKKEQEKKLRVGAENQKEIGLPVPVEELVAG